MNGRRRLQISAALYPARFFSSTLKNFSIALQIISNPACTQWRCDGERRSLRDFLASVLFLT
jgi:hypothetical protein